jgi:fatty acid desaturase
MYEITTHERKKGITACYFKITFFVFSTLLLSFTILVFNTSILIPLLLSLCLGILYGHATGLQHEFTHGILPYRKLNYWLGLIIGLLLTVGFTEYRLDHMKHHMFLGTPKNNEIFVKRDMGSLSLITLLNNIFMLPHHLNTLKKIIQSWSKKGVIIGNQKQNTLATREYRAMSIFILLIVVCSAYYNLWILLYLWIIPVFLIALPIRSMIEIAEHFGCDTTTTDVYANSRVINGRFSGWLTNGNNYHVAHHLHPSCPLSLTRKIYNKLTIPTKTIGNSYIVFYTKLIIKLTRKK